MLPQNKQKMQQPPKQQKLQIKTSTFQIDVLLSDAALQIELRDLVDWAIYKRIYTEQDIGMQIHRKTDLIDIFNSLSENNAKSDENQQQNQQTSYQFGTVIKNKQIPSFKVEKGGKLTIYVVFMDLRTKKQMLYESKLQLKKVRDFTQTQISHQKSAKQQKNAYQIFIKQIEQVKKQNSKLSERVKRLQEQNRQLKSRITFDQDIISELKTQFKQFKMSLEQKKLPSPQKMDKNEKLEIFNKKNEKYFEVTQNKIKYIGPNVQYTNFILDKEIPKLGQFKFSVNMVKTSSNVVMIGVIDANKQIQSVSSYNSGNAINYQGCNGYKCPEKNCSGPGFKQGETVEVAVNLQNKSIIYKVKGNQIMKIVNGMLGDASRTFKPYVEMRDTNDMIQVYL